MSIPVTCGHCQSSFRVKDRYEGTTGACPQCGGKIVVPARPVEPEEEDSDLHVLSVNAIASMEMKDCEKCGKRNPSDATECFFCGEPASP
jgi:DNA-directed RNA polymerase subunit RPC12/RpoP